MSGREDPEEQALCQRTVTTCESSLEGGPVDILLARQPTVSSTYAWCAQRVLYNNSIEVSAKSSTGISPNYQLLLGPNLYPKLTFVICKFRVWEIAITADISKMFRGV